MERLSDADARAFEQGWDRMSERPCDACDNNGWVSPTSDDQEAGRMYSLCPLRCAASRNVA